MKKWTSLLIGTVAASFACGFAQADPTNYDTRTMKEQRYETNAQGKRMEKAKRDVVRDKNNGTYSTAERPNYGSRSNSNLDRNPNKPINQQ